VRRESPREILAAEESLTRRRTDLDGTFHEIDHRDVERASTEIEDEQDTLPLAVVESVASDAAGRLVEDSHDLQPGNSSGVERRLPLMLVKIGGHRDHRTFDRTAKMDLGIVFERTQD